MFDKIAYIEAKNLNITNNININGIVCMDYYKKEFINPLFTGYITYINRIGNITEIRYYKNGKKISSLQTY